MAKVQKTILGKEIKSFSFCKKLDYRFNRMRVIGLVRLEGGEMIHVRFNEFKILNQLGEVSGMVLKTNPGYKRIKRMIARWFTTYRNGSKGGQMHHVAYWRSRAVDGMHNINLFKNSGISFSENRSNFLRLAS
ncbi:hypothetical protein JOE44_001983 [Chryseobacterium sp. PvR013]|uniref:hypothetical protein n=1 Tax=Chryseobacterium sp. PvR013 TaxID=2806595 RepID=UPI001AE6A994|nr:hypothetical protein [Chryseobacterium sp. PvR013]MBP1165099.1 hypothetical protein [Chryseobacterium sp. PvR013]